MVRMKLGFAAVALCLSAGLASGFQEQGGASGSAAAGGQGAQVAPGTAPSPKADKGIEIKLPGLGTLGVVPKLDFGLELLYGAAETGKPSDPPSAIDPQSDDVMIRGTVKRRF